MESVWFKDVSDDPASHPPRRRLPRCDCRFCSLQAQAREEEIRCCMLQIND